LVIAGAPGKKPKKNSHRALAYAIEVTNHEITVAEDTDSEFGGGGRWRSQRSKTKDTMQAFGLRELRQF
jgi:hypothetical protein